MNLVGASFQLDVTVSILNAFFCTVNDDQCVIFFDYFLGVIKDAAGERSELIGNFLQKVSTVFAEENSGILAFMVLKTQFSAS